MKKASTDAVVPGGVEEYIARLHVRLPVLENAKASLAIMKGKP